MGWIVYPGNLVYPPNRFLSSTNKVFYGTGSDNGLFCFDINSKSFPYDWCIYTDIGFDYKITQDGVEEILYLSKYPYNQASQWSGLYDLFYTDTYGWILAKWKHIEPIEYSYTDENGVKTWYENEWWSMERKSYSLPENLDESAIFIPRGSLKNNPPSNITLQVYFNPKNLWVKNGGGRDHLGVYYKYSDPTNFRVVGIPKFRDSTYKEYLRSFSKGSNGKYTYGDIYFDDTSQKWVIGTVGDENGWWEGEEPSFSESITFKFTTNLGSTIVKPDINITFDQCVKESVTETTYLYEANIWR